MFYGVDFNMRAVFIVLIEELKCLKTMGVIIVSVSSESLETLRKVVVA